MMTVPETSGRMPKVLAPSASGFHLVPKRKSVTETPGVEKKA